MNFKMSAKILPFCPGDNELTHHITTLHVLNCQIGGPFQYLDAILSVQEFPT